MFFFSRHIDRQLSEHLFSRLSFIIVFFLIKFISIPSFAQENSIGLLESVRIALENQPAIEFGRLDVEFAEGVYQEASGQFDIYFQSGVEHGETRRPLANEQYADYQLETDTSYHLGLSKQFRTGLELLPEFRTTRTELDLDTLPGGFSLVPESRTGAYIVARLPLLRGFGTEAAAGMETAARQDVEVFSTELQHVISEVVHETSQAYWRYVLDHLYLKQYLEAERLAEQHYEQTLSLVKGDELPAAELDEAQANLSDKKTARMNIEQALMESRLNLGIIMGVPSGQIHSLPPPGDDFSLVETGKEMLSRTNDWLLIEHALLERNDLKASKEREKSFAILNKVFRDQLRPNLELGMLIGYESLKEGDSYNYMLESVGSSIHGLSWQVSLTYEFPVENRKARGRLGQQNAEKNRQALKSRELMRNIQSNVRNTLSVLRQNIAEHQNAQKTVDLYEKAFENQLMKFRMGMATQLDLINTQDRLTLARLRRIETHFKCASSLSRLRFQTATLVSFVKNQAMVDLESLTRMPETSLEG